MTKRTRRPTAEEATAAENERIMDAIGWERPGRGDDKTAELLAELRQALEREESARVEAQRRNDDYLDAKAVHRRAAELVREIEREIREGATGRPLIDRVGTVATNGEVAP